MASDSAISRSDLWRVTHETLQAACSLLSIYEGKDYVLVEEVLSPIRKLVAHGKDYEAMKGYKTPMTETAIPSTSDQIEDLIQIDKEVTQTHNTHVESSVSFDGYILSERVEGSYTVLTSNPTSEPYTADDSRLFSSPITTNKSTTAVAGTGDIGNKQQLAQAEDSFNLDLVEIEQNLPRTSCPIQQPSAIQLLYTPFDFKQDLNNTETFVDSIGLTDKRSGIEMLMFKLTKPEHLDMINIPPEGFKYTVTITYHLATNRHRRETTLKALGLYLSTGEAYTVIVEKACLLSNCDIIQHTKLGHLLTQPSVRRICWCPGYVQGHMIQKLGFPIGSCIDLSARANYGRQQANKTLFSLGEAINNYLTTWNDKYRFFEAKEDYEKALKSKKGKKNPWDRINLSTVIEYNSLLGFATHFLYFQTLKVVKAEPKLFFYKYEQ